MISSGHIVWRVQAIDNNGRNCVISLNSSTPFISIEYKDKIFFYDVIVLLERPWDYPEDLKAFDPSEDKGAFTDEEIDALFNSWAKLKIAISPLKFW